MLPREHTDQHTPYKDGWNTNCNMNSDMILAGFEPAFFFFVRHVHWATVYLDSRIVILEWKTIDMVATQIVTCSNSQTLESEGGILWGRDGIVWRWPELYGGKVEIKLNIGDI